MFSQENLIQKLFHVDDPKRPVLHHEGFKTSAILFLIIPSPDKPFDLVLMRRTQDRRDRHSGEISFPGGRQEPGESLVGTALRECEEEFGIPRDAVHVIGSFDDYSTPKKYIMTPIVGWIESGVTMHKNDKEVDEIIRVPIDFFATPENYAETIYELDTGDRISVVRYTYRVPGGKTHVIWGATGHLIARFIELAFGIVLKTPGTRRATPGDFIKIFKK